MARAVIQAEHGSLALEWSYDGDYFVGVHAAGYGYEGEAGAHVTSEQFSAFQDALLRLEESRNGSAKLESVVPGEFSFEVSSIDRLGHLGVSGELRSDKTSANGAHVNLLRFSFEFDPELLASFVRAVAA